VMRPSRPVGVVRRRPDRVNRRFVIAAVPLVLSWSVTVVPDTESIDDQVEAEGAISVFNDRLTEAGWVSSGPPERAEPREDDPFSDCLSFAYVVFANTAQHLEGETARAVSDEFRSGDLDPDSTDPVPDYGYIAAGAFTVTRSSVEVLDDIITRLGATESATCLTEPGNAQGDTATTTNDIGVGDSSARLDVSYSVGDLDQVTESLLAARVDRSLVTMVVFTGGEFELDLDPVAELNAIVEAVRRNDNSPE
jgi:hypothetical protein